MLRRSIAVIAVLVCANAAAQSMDQTPPRVVAPDKLATYWTRAQSSIDADVPNFGKNIHQPGCATVSFVVEPTGGTSTFKVQRVVPAGDLGKVAASVAAGLRFDPTPSNKGRTRVFSWLIFPFNLPADHAARTAVMRPCEIEKLDAKDM